MTEIVGTCVTCENFLEYLKKLPWCKQGQNTLVAVSNCSMEMIETFKDHEVKVHPGGMPIKVNMSWLLFLNEKIEEGRPLPMVLVWKPEAVELWYRRHKSWDFPWDAWQSTTAEAYDRECVRLPAQHCDSKFGQYHKELLAKAKECPTTIPKQ